MRTAIIIFSKQHFRKLLYIEYGPIYGRRYSTVNNITITITIKINTNCALCIIAVRRRCSNNRWHEYNLHLQQVVQIGNEHVRRR